MEAGVLNADSDAFQAGRQGRDDEACVLPSVGTLTRLKVDHLFLLLRV